MMMGLWCSLLIKQKAEVVVFLFGYILHSHPDQSQNYSEESYYSTDHPEAHDDLSFGPADCFEVMVDWCDAEDFFAVAKFF